MEDSAPPHSSTPCSSSTPLLVEVVPGLWVCAEAALPAALADPLLGVTHLVSIGYPPPDDPLGLGGAGGEQGEGEGNARVRVLRIELEDDADGDLLTQIPSATAFISEGLRLRDSNIAAAAAAAAANDGGDGARDADTSTISAGDGGGAHRPTAGGSGRSVLVHCHAGVSRSVAVVVAHVMRTTGVVRRWKAPKATFGKCPSVS